MSKLFHQYDYAVRDMDEFKNYYLADKTLTEATAENSMNANQYFYSFESYFSFKSDGTKRCGVLFNLDNLIKIGDMLEVSVEFMSTDGTKPAIIYSEGATKYLLNRMNGQDGFELVSACTPISDRTGTKKGEVFIGLDVGESGTFRMRFPRTRHYAQIEYAPSQIRKKTKIFQLAKNNGLWANETTAFYRLLDPASISVNGNNLSINFTKPFIVEVPQVFIQTNASMGGHTVHFGYRAKDQMILNVFQNGTQVAWNTVPDGAVMNVKCEVGMYY